MRTITQDKENTMGSSVLTAHQALEGRAALERHYASFSPAQDRDFRAASLNRLVARLVPAGDVLDLGCGSGGLTALLLRRGLRVTSQDPSDEMRRLCRARLSEQGLPADGVVSGTATDIESGRFDAIVNLDVIEHIEDDRAAVAAMYRGLRRNGTLVLAVPAMSRLYGPKDVEVGHYRRYDRDGLERLLTDVGFEIERTRWWNAIGVLPVWLTGRRGRRVAEDFRYGGRTRGQAMLNAMLRFWLTAVEGRVRPPRGLTLLVVARRR